MVTKLTLGSKMKLSNNSRRIYTKIVPLCIRQGLESVLLPSYPKEYDDRQYIFIHIPKTAGKSIISKLHNRGATHLCYSDYEEILGEKLKNYFIFTVIRDPADRFASAFSYLKAGGNQSKEDKAFAKQWIKNKDLNDFIETSFQHDKVKNSFFFRSQASFLKNKNGQIAHIKILRLNSLQEDFASISGRLGVSPDLPYLNKSNSKQNVLSENAKRIIEQTYQEDYQLFHSSSES